MKQYTRAFSDRIHTRHVVKYRIHSDMKRVPRKATLFYREIQCSFSWEIYRSWVLVIFHAL